jgi:hypothetical protein
MKNEKSHLDGEIKPSISQARRFTCSHRPSVAVCMMAAAASSNV